MYLEIEQFLNNHSPREGKQMNKLIVVSPAHSTNGRSLSEDGLFQLETLARRINVLTKDKKVFIFHSMSASAKASASFLLDDISVLDKCMHEFIELSSDSYESGREAALKFSQFSEDYFFDVDTVVILITHSLAVSGIVDYFLRIENGKRFKVQEVDDASGFCLDMETCKVIDFSWAD